MTLSFKTSILALGLVATASFATAGGMAPVIGMAPDMIEETTAGSSSSAGLIIPLILIALVAAALSSSGGDTLDQI